MFETQVNYISNEWCSIRDENNNNIYLYESYGDALNCWEKLQNQYPECKLKVDRKSVV